MCDYHISAAEREHISAPKFCRKIWLLAAILLLVPTTEILFMTERIQVANKSVKVQKPQLMIHYLEYWIRSLMFHKQNILTEILG